MKWRRESHKAKLVCNDQPRQVCSNSKRDRSCEPVHEYENEGPEATRCVSKTREPVFSLQFVNEAKPENIKAAKNFESRGVHVERWIQQMLKKGILERARKEKLSYITKHFAVPKKDTTEMRVVGDFKRLNDVTKVLPGKSLDALSIASWLSKYTFKTKTDLTKGFYVIDVQAESRPFLGIYSHNRYYQYKKMPMGVRNGPSTFSVFGQFILEQLEEKDRPFVRCMQDDFFCGHAEEEECMQITNRLREILIKHRATVNAAKSSVCPVKELNCLGYLVQNQVTATPDRLKKLSEMLRKTKLGEVMTKRQRAKVLGHVQFVAQRNRQVTESLRPAYSILNSMPEWSSNLPLTSTEVDCYRNAMIMITNPTTAQQQAKESKQVVFTDASNKFLSCKIGSKAHTWRHTINKKKSSTYKEVAAVVKTLECIELKKGITWFLDNSSAVQILNKMESKSLDIQKIIAPCKHKVKELEVEFKFIRGYENPADAASRAGLSSRQARYKAQRAYDNRKLIQDHKKEIQEKRFKISQESV